MVWVSVFIIRVIHILYYRVRGVIVRTLGIERVVYIFMSCVVRIRGIIAFFRVIVLFIEYIVRVFRIVVRRFRIERVV